MSKHEEGIVILGSTGSIGKSSLEVIRCNKNRFKIDGLTCASNIDLLAEQIIEFNPKLVSVGKGNADKLRDRLGKRAENIEILEGTEGNIEVATYPKADKLIAAIVGAAGVEPTMAGIQSKKTIALANKEALVLTGEIMMETARSHQVDILPVDSEHNAVFQALQGSRGKQVRNITLTASGGPFRTKPIEEFVQISLRDALNHPNWCMGPKITIDSATMMNKALEIIEAHWLFDLDPDQIHVLVHPQSVIHSTVTYIDGSTIAQLGVPDMKIPIAYSLGYPDRIPSNSTFLDLGELGMLTFEKPDPVRFPTIQLAYDVLKMGGGAPAALNGANEALVELFLKECISFVGVIETLQKVVSDLAHYRPELSKKNQHPYLSRIDTVQDAIKADQWGRDFVEIWIDRKIE